MLLKSNLRIDVFSCSCVPARDVTSEGTDSHRGWAQDAVSTDLSLHYASVREREICHQFC